MPTTDDDAGGIVRLQSGNASAELSLTGAEPLSWRLGDRDLLWHGDPAHWEWRAPLLFPVVGASAGDVIRVGHQDYPMPRHGFARDSLFTIRERTKDSARFQLKESHKTWTHYPFRFVLDVTAVITEGKLYGFGLIRPG